MTTKTKQIVQVKITFEGEDLENWEKLKSMWQGASATSILRMAVNGVVKNQADQQINKSTKKRTPEENVDLIENWLEKKADHNLTPLEEEEAFSDWWMANKNELRG